MVTSSQFNQYQSIDGGWYEPRISEPCGDSDSALAVWVGIGFGHSLDTQDTVAQDGTLPHVPGYTDHAAWTEVWPYQSIVQQPLEATAGSEFDAQVWYEGGSGEWRFIMDNKATGQSLDITVYNMPPIEDQGSAAEFIAERPAYVVNGNYQLWDLSDFDYIDWLGAQVNQANIGNYSSSLAAVNMYGGIDYGAPFGNWLAGPGDIVDNRKFTDYYYTCS